MNDDDNERQYSGNNANRGGGILGLIVIIALCWWGYNHFVKKDYSKPWWKGAATQRVCATGYNQDCNNQLVYSNGDSIDSISFPNGGYLHGYSECFEAASFYEYDQFCRFYDQQGRKWDVTPL